MQSITKVMKATIEKFRNPSVIRFLPSIYYYDAPFGWGLGFEYLRWSISIYVEVI